LREALEGLIAEFGSPQGFTRLQPTWPDATSPIPTWRAPLGAPYFGQLPCQGAGPPVLIRELALLPGHAMTNDPRLSLC
jgi:hypothetical protein